ncbi:MAG: SAVED domain-containing protein [Alphaproteobacteria bacterium]|nr:SAVED domain-containing protein [Alphaproteobacteria bacterium]
MTELYEYWCDADRSRNRDKNLWRLSELQDGREHALDELPGRVLSHYVSDEEVAKILNTLGYPATAECIRTLLPEGTVGRSGDLGEILATEFVEEWLGYEVPVRKLRDKDHRDMAMRGEDVIGVAYDDDDRLILLKGEAKSAQALSRSTVEKARKRLDEDYGRPSAHSLIFVGRKLIQSDDPDRKEVGKAVLREATSGAMSVRRIAHLLFTLTGNQVDQLIQNDLDGADGSRPQHSVNLRISDHRDFVEAIYEGAYEEAGSVGDG